MAESLACPSIVRLRELLLGTTPEAEAESLELHVLGCVACASQLKTLETDDTLVGALREQLVGKTPGEGKEGGDTELRHRLKALHPAASNTEGRRPPSEQDLREALDCLGPPQEPGDLGRLGPYRVRKVLDVGGMGVVYEALDPDLERPVALKTIRMSLAPSTQARQRFLREARAAAAIEHEHIVTVFHVGEHRGLPYLVMPMLKGESLESRLHREIRLPAREVLRIGREAAAGLAAAHARGLTHRDVKPANLWLEGESARVKLLDFGLARAAGDDEGLTQAGLVLGTPAYMAPEQAAGQAVDGRTDLFSLGCVLYRAATGRVPFPGGGLYVNSPHAAVLEPERPERINPEVPAPLSALILRLLARDPAGRPGSAEDVSRALEALEHAPEVAGRWLRPRQTGAGRWKRVAGIALALALIGGGAVAAYQIIATLNNSKPVVETDDSNVQVPPPASSPLDALRRETIPAEELKEAGGDRAPRDLVAILGDSRLMPWGGCKGVEFGPGGTSVVSAGNHELRLWNLHTGRAFGPPFPDPSNFIDFIEAFAVSPDGTRAVSGGREDWVRVWDLTRSCELIPLRGTGYVTALAFSPDGKRIASGGLDKTARVWDAATGKLFRILSDHSFPVRAVAFSSDGNRLACGMGEGNFDEWRQAPGVRVWDVATSKQAVAVEGADDTGWSVAIRGDGVLVAGGHDAIKSWKTGGGRPESMLVPGVGDVIALTFTPDGRRLAGGCEDRRARVWDWDSRRQIAVTGLHAERVRAVAFSPDGNTLATAAFASPIGLWEASTGRPLLGGQSLAGCAWSVAPGPDGTAVVGHSDGGIRLWELFGPCPRLRMTLEGHDGVARRLAWHPDGHRLASCSDDGTLRLWNIDTGKQRWSRQELPLQELDLAFTRAGDHIFTGNRGRLTLWHTDSGRQLQQPLRWDVSPGDKGEFALALCPSGKELLAHTLENDVVLRDSGGKLERTLSGSTEPLGAIAFSPDGSRLAGVTYRRSVVVWEVPSGRVLNLLLNASPEFFTSVAFSPDGRWLAASSYDGAVWAWDTSDWTPRRKIKIGEKGYEVRQVAFCPDSRHLLAANKNGTVYVLRLADLAGQK